MASTDRPQRPRMVVTGASEQIGRHLLDAIRGDYQIFGIADCSQIQSGAPVHQNVTWFQIDISDRDATLRTFRRIRETGGADFVIHLASDPGPGSRRVNVDGLRNVLLGCRELKPNRFVFARPEKSQETTEATEELLREYARDHPLSRIQFASRPRVVVTGASGFVGRHLLRVIKEDYQVFALARSSQQACGAPVHPNISWIQVDIADRQALTSVIGKIRDGGGADLVVHLAAYYDFAGDERGEYERTNVQGLRYLLEACKKLRPGLFLFASSVAASEFPPQGAVLTESSPANGSHIYAVTKRIGEQMLQEYRDDFPSVIVRYGALFSDWCEYPPVFISLERWRSRVWDRRVLGGRGLFGVPYLHIRDVQSFMTRVLGRAKDLEPGEVLLASSDDPVSMRDMFGQATRCLFGRAEQPVKIPKPICRVGLHAKDIAGRVLGERPFERPWMGRYIDCQMRVDARHTRQRLGWAPRERLGLLRRLPFLIENLRIDPTEWHRRNHAAMEKLRTAAHLRIHWLMEKNEDRIGEALVNLLQARQTWRCFADRPDLPVDELHWSHKVALHQLMNAVRTLDPGIYASYCRDLAERRFAQGAARREVCAGLEALSDACLQVLRKDPDAAGMQREIQEQLNMTTLFGCDKVDESFEELGELQVRRRQRMTET